MKTLLLTAAVAFCLLQSQQAYAVKHTITASDFSFAPATLTVQLGDTIQWVHLNGDHTTTSVSIPSGAAPWNAPLAAATPGFMYVPTVAGAYNYVCTPHASMGMAGNFTVTSPNAVKEPNSVAISVAPNPAGSVIRITSASVIEEVAVIDLSGRASVLPGIGRSGNERSFSVAHLAEGWYLVRVRSKEGIASERILVGR